MKPLFLPKPSAIRSAIRDAIARASKLDFAVAFVGYDWQDILGSARAPLRVVCWLTSTNTNPFAVRQLMRRLGTRVKQMDRMHAKVYLAHGANAAIVGSANLSVSALAENDIAGQGEAAVLVRGKNDVAPVVTWFRDLWNSARIIKGTDLNNAERAWQAAHAGGGFRQPRRGASKSSGPRQTAAAIPAAWRPSRTLQELADTVRGMDLGRLAGLKGLAPAKLSVSHKRLIVDTLSKWAGHAGAFRPFLAVPLSQSRRALEGALNSVRPIEERLKDLQTHGRSKVAGLDLTAWTMVLYWWRPDLYPPFNTRTKRFAQAFGFQKFLPRSLTPRGYARWIQFAQVLSARLQLPTAGHVDRLVWEYTK